MELLLIIICISIVGFYIVLKITEYKYDNLRNKNKNKKKKPLWSYLPIIGEYYLSEDKKEKIEYEQKVLETKHPLYHLGLAIFFIAFGVYGIYVNLHIIITIISYLSILVGISAIYFAVVGYKKSS